MKKFIFGYVILGSETCRYWNGYQFAASESIAKKYATRPGIRRAISNMLRRGTIPYRKYFIMGVEQ